MKKLRVNSAYFKVLSELLLWIMWVLVIEDCHCIPNLTHTYLLIAAGARLSRTYEIDRPVNLKMARPLILFGPLKERITEELLQRPSEFATCIQRTLLPHHFCTTLPSLQLPGHYY